MFSWMLKITQKFLLNSILSVCQCSSCTKIAHDQTNAILFRKRECKVAVRSFPSIKIVRLHRDAQLIIHRVRGRVGRPSNIKNEINVKYKSLEKQKLSELEISREPLRLKIRDEHDAVLGAYFGGVLLKRRAQAVEPEAERVPEKLPEVQFVGYSFCR